MTDSKAHTHDGKGLISYPNIAAPGVPYFSPLQSPPSGTAVSSNPPLLFQPLKLRGLTMQNRIMVSPLCQYSAEDGHVTDWIMAHIGGIVSRGPGLTIIEATAVQEVGRITPEDAGIWKDSHIAPLKRLTDFAHSQSQHIGIQLAHAGRKASTVAPWLVRKGTAIPENGGWPDRVYGPTSEPYDETSPIPHEMTLEDIEQLKSDWQAAARRAVAAGFDTIEVHGAHGYLLHSFYSPFSNKRTDKYGGSFENRIRLPLEIIELTRKEMPKDMPLLVRMTGSDWLEHLDSPSWTVEDAKKFAIALADTGHVDLLDISSSALSPLQKITIGPDYHANFSRAVRDAVAGRGIAVGVVGGIADGKLAERRLQEGTADVAVVGRAFQKNPGMVWKMAEDLGVHLQVRMANQIGWAFGQTEGVKGVDVNHGQ